MISVAKRTPTGPKNSPKMKLLLCGFVVTLFFNSCFTFEGDKAGCEISSFWTQFSKGDCRRDNLKNALDCANQNFTCVPNWPMSIGNKILLGGNRIRILTHDIFGRQFNNKWDLERLLQLDLSHNQIETIESSSFLSLKSLEIIQLDYNLLSQVPSSSLAPLFELKGIHLSGNPIGRIKSNDFPLLLKLQELSLDSCELSELAKSPFQNLPALTTLRLNSNQLIKVSIETFNGLRNLETLELKNNQLMTMDFGLKWPPSELPKIVELQISGNPIVVTKSAKSKWYKEFIKITQQEPKDKQGKEECEKKSLYSYDCDFDYVDHNAQYQCSGQNIKCIPIFKSGVDCKIISITNTRLDVLDFKIFQRQFSPTGLTDMTNLDLSSNQIKFIHEYAFFGLNSIVGLDLSRNQLTYIPFKSLQHLNSLKILNLSSNQLFSEEQEDTEWKEIIFKPMQKLSLANCSVPQDEIWNIFHMARNVVSLRLGYNSFKNIPLPPSGSESLNNSESVVEFLFLNNNELSSLSFSFHPYFGHLKELNLDKNPIKFDISDSVSLQSNRIEVLSLKDCNISSIPFGAFAGFTNLRSLVIDGNKFTEIDGDPFARLIHLEKLTMNGIVSGGLMRKDALKNSNTRREDTKLAEVKVGTIGEKCKCDVTGSHCIGTWIPESTEGNLIVVKCSVTNRWYRALEFIKTNAEWKLLLVTFIYAGFFLPIFIIPAVPFVRDLVNILFY